MSQEKRLSRAKQLLEKLGLGDKWQNKPSQLSGGQQQRVSIARALMNGGEIILADEPTGALDSQSGQNVMEILRQLHAEGHTIIMVTHDREIAASANRVIEIKDGEIIGDTQKEAVKSAVENQAKSKPHFGFSKDQFVEAFRMSVSAIIAPQNAFSFNHARDYYRDYVCGFRCGIGKRFTTKKSWLTLKALVQVP